MSKLKDFVLGYLEDRASRGEQDPMNTPEFRKGYDEYLLRALKDASEEKHEPR